MNETPVMKPSRNVIWENLISIYPGAVLYGLLFNVSLMIDSIIAGQSLGAGGIAAVALGVPGYGAPAAADYFAENIVMGIQNNLILAGFPGDALILPVSEVVCNISYFASGTIKGAAIATEPLFGVYYEERDVNSIKKVWKQGWLMGLIMSVVWAALFYAALPLLSTLCGMELSQDISRGVLLCMVFTPVMHTVYMFTLYYEATKQLPCPWRLPYFRIPACMLL